MREKCLWCVQNVHRCLTFFTYMVGEQHFLLAWRIMTIQDSQPEKRKESFHTSVKIINKYSLYGFHWYSCYYWVSNHLDCFYISGHVSCKFQTSAQNLRLLFRKNLHLKYWIKLEQLNCTWGIQRTSLKNGKKSINYAKSLLRTSICIK